MRLYIILYKHLSTAVGSGCFPHAVTRFLPFVVQSLKVDDDVDDCFLIGESEFVPFGGTVCRGELG